MPDAIPVIPPKVKRFWSHPVVLLLCTAVVYFPLVSGYVFASVSGSQLVQFLTIPTSVLAAWLLIRLRGLRWRDVGLCLPRSVGRAAVVAVLGTGLLLALSAGVEQVLSHVLGTRADTRMFDVLRGNPVGLVIYLILLVWPFAAVAEELLFRGYFQNSLRGVFLRVAGDRWATAWAVVASNTLFAVLHLYQGVSGVVVTGVVGCALALTYLAAGRNLWAAIVAHGLYDTVALTWITLNLDR